MATATMETTVCGEIRKREQEGGRVSGGQEGRRWETGAHGEDEPGSVEDLERSFGRHGGRVD